jgi:hypothetical protein
MELMQSYKRPWTMLVELELTVTLFVKTLLVTTQTPLELIAAML